MPASDDNAGVTARKVIARQPTFIIYLKYPTNNRLGATQSAFRTSLEGQVLPFSNDRSWPLNLVPLLAQVLAKKFELPNESCRTISTALVRRQSDLNLPIVLRRLVGSFSLQLAVREGY